MGSLRSLRKSSVPQTRRGGKQQPVKHLATFPSLSLSPQSAEVNTDKVRWQKWEIIVTTVPHTIAPPKLIKAHRTTAEAERIIHALFPFHFRSFFLSHSLSIFCRLFPLSRRSTSFLSIAHDSQHKSGATECILATELGTPLWDLRKKAHAQLGFLQVVWFSDVWNRP